MSDENKVVKSPKQRTEDFLYRISEQLDKMGVKKGNKEIILNLLEVEIKHPTIDEKDAMSRYRDIIENNME